MEILVETTFAALDCFSSIAYCIVNFIVTCGVKHKTKLNIFFEYFLMFLALFLVTVEFVLGNLKLASCLNVARRKCPGKNPGCKSIQ